ncbi:uncharacterized protein LOC121781931 isoform X1 [Salvia splendens]|uniref:uncharacterized protein LOC121781931 isoform X1 n=1 Tax=Salvia splendens TaxID=180675 RepID=UPI001C27C792|nr:uncharacterized protein LOC121781931 isoform X1 [Salvia splendens]XP_042035569.1 uncharacterized protein LOC121781931 isoform X1 [Salvia splendens]
MYEGRSHKSAVEFLWVGGQQLDPFVITFSEIAKETFPGFPEKELTWWEMNILGRLNKYENPNRLLNIFDIVAALRAFKQSAPKYVEHILLKWLASCLGSKCEISHKLLSEAPKLRTMHSSRQLHRINIISREVVLKEFMTENVSGKEHVLEGSSCDKKEEINLWMDFLLSCEKELLLRLVSISISSEEFSGVGGDGLPQMKQWLLQNVKDEYIFLAAEIREVKKRKLEETSEHEVHERCHFCTGIVPFESTEYATCSGSIDKNGVNRTHKLQRCAVTLQVLPTKPSWYCMCCHRRASKMAPTILFAMPTYRSDFKSFIESPTHKHTSTPYCPFCGILLHRSQPQYFLSPSPV